MSVTHEITFISRYLEMERNLEKREEESKRKK